MQFTHPVVRAEEWLVGTTHGSAAHRLRAGLGLGYGDKLDTGRKGICGVVLQRGRALLFKPILQG